MSKSTEILNAFRNKYYTDGNNTENGIVANAINEILPEYIKLKKNEVKHGKWETYFGGKLLMCSGCKTSFYNADEIEGTNYCPYCGARMDGEE